MGNVVTPTVVPMGMTENLVRFADAIGVKATGEVLTTYARTLASMKLLLLTPEEDAAVSLLASRCNDAVNRIRKEHNV